MKPTSTLSLLLLFACTAFRGTAQTTAPPPDKVSHAEPLYMDLVRDLGARKGEKEWNVGLSLEDKNRYHTLGGLVEYEFAPANRLGVEVEVPFAVHFKTDRRQKVELPTGGIEGLKVATQYTFFVSTRLQLSMAAGYANDLEFNIEREDGRMQLNPGNISQPFIVAAKSWSRSRFHTLLYTAPTLGVNLRTGHLEKRMLLNANFHYMFPGTKNFVGLEVNQRFGDGGTSVVLRPQVRVGLSKGLMLGMVTGIPVVGHDEGISLFCRLIYEPGKSKR